jgi:hypothetical protein
MGPLNVILPLCSRSLLYILLSCDYNAKMTEYGDFQGGMEINDNLSTVLGTDTFADRGMVPAGYNNTPSSAVDGLIIAVIRIREVASAGCVARSRQVCIELIVEALLIRRN